MNPTKQNAQSYRLYLTALAFDSLKWADLSKPGPTPGEIIRKAFGQSVR